MFVGTEIIGAYKFLLANDWVYIGYPSFFIQIVFREVISFLSDENYNRVCLVKNHSVSEGFLLSAKRVQLVYY